MEDSSPVVVIEGQSVSSLSLRSHVEGFLVVHQYERVVVYDISVCCCVKARCYVFRTVIGMM